MARVINTNSPGKRRSAYRRTIAEILRRLSQQRDVNVETKDMVAMLVICLRGIDGTIEESISAWEKRGYWKKADEFQQNWWWCSLSANAIEELIKAEDWDKLPDTIMRLFPHFSDIRIKKMTRNPDEWAGSFSKLSGKLKH